MIILYWPTHGAIKESEGAPKQHQNDPKSPEVAKWSNKAQHGPSGHKTVLRDIIHDYMPYWPTHGAI